MSRNNHGFFLPEKKLLARNLLKGNFEVCLVTKLVGEKNQSHLKWLPVDRFFFFCKTDNILCSINRAY